MSSKYRYMNNNEVTAVLGRKWRELTPERRLPYIEKSAMLKANYEAQQKLEGHFIAPKTPRKRQTKKEKPTMNCFVEATKEGDLKRKNWFASFFFSNE